MTTRLRSFTILFITILVALAVLVAWKAFWEPTPAPPNPHSTKPERTTEQTRLLLQKGWAVGDASLTAAEAEQLAQLDAMIDRSVAPLNEFFARTGRDGALPFAQRLLGWRGKWAFLKAQAGSAARERYHAMIHQEFALYLFKDEDLHRELVSAIERFLAELRAANNAVLMRVHGDITETLPELAEVLPHLRSEAAFASHFQQIAQKVLPGIAGQFRVMAGTDVASAILGTVAAKVLTRVATTVATRLGVSGTALGIGAGASVGTLGLSVVAAILVDAAIDQVMRVTGNAPDEKIARQVVASLNTLRDRLLDGDPDAWNALRALQDAAQDDSSSRVRERSAEVVGLIERSGNLGMKETMRLLYLDQVKLRREALRYSIEGGRP